VFEKPLSIIETENKIKIKLPPPTKLNLLLIVLFAVAIVFLLTFETSRADWFGGYHDIFILIGCVLALIATSISTVFSLMRKITIDKITKTIVYCHWSETTFTLQDISSVEDVHEEPRWSLIGLSLLRSPAINYVNISLASNGKIVKIRTHSESQSRELVRILENLKKTS